MYSHMRFAHLKALDHHYWDWTSWLLRSERPLLQLQVDLHRPVSG